MADLTCRDECKYHGFLGLVEWCRHPDHLGPIGQTGPTGPTGQVIDAAGRCKSKVAWDARVMPGMEPPWPMPVKLRELFPVGPCTQIASEKRI